MIHSTVHVFNQDRHCLPCLRINLYWTAIHPNLDVSVYEAGLMIVAVYSVITLEYRQMLRYGRKMLWTVFGFPEDGPFSLISG